MPRHDKTDVTESGTKADLTNEEGIRKTSTTAVATADGPLAGIRRAETIADRTDFGLVRRELPPRWDVRPDLVQFGSEPLAETVRFRRGQIGPQIVLKPTCSEKPISDIEFYERSGARASRRQTMTVKTLSEALRVAVNRAYQLG